MNETEGAAAVPHVGVGPRLAAAREAAGYDRKQLAGITKIPERHLDAIERGDFSALPARAYAVGFSRSYARAVGEDEEAIVALVREELAGTVEPRRVVPAFEPGDPARVPTARFAWIAALGALIAALIGTWVWRGQEPATALPSILPEESAAAVAAPLPTPEPLPPLDAAASEGAAVLPAPLPTVAASTPAPRTAPPRPRAAQPQPAAAASVPAPASAPAALPSASTTAAPTAAPAD
jgi:cytoskeletal protein RodZ